MSDRIIGEPNTWWIRLPLVEVDVDIMYSVLKDLDFDLEKSIKKYEEEHPRSTDKA